MRLPEALTDCPTYQTVEAFYAGRLDRQISREADYGVMWQLNGDRWPQWRVSYVQQTGEVYACCHHRDVTPRVIVLGTLPCDREVEGPDYYRELDRLLGSWWEHRSLEWVRQVLVEHERSLEIER